MIIGWKKSIPVLNSQFSLLSIQIAKVESNDEKQTVNIVSILGNLFIVSVYIVWIFIRLTNLYVLTLGNITNTYKFVDFFVK